MLTSQSLESLHQFQVFGLVVFLFGRVSSRDGSDGAGSGGRDGGDVGRVRRFFATQDASFGKKRRDGTDVTFGGKNGVLEAKWMSYRE